jgi:hypothetical protein
MDILSLNSLVMPSFAFPLFYMPHFYIFAPRFF